MKTISSSAKTAEPIANRKHTDQYNIKPHPLSLPWNADKPDMIIINEVLKHILPSTLKTFWIFWGVMGHGLNFGYSSASG
jgi:hypothetical protein